jgi:hypothetical protein
VPILRASWRLGALCLRAFAAPLILTAMVMWTLEILGFFCHSGDKARISTISQHLSCIVCKTVSHGEIPALI